MKTLVMFAWLALSVVTHAQTLTACTCGLLVPTGTGATLNPINLCTVAHWNTLPLSASQGLSYRLCRDINFNGTVVPVVGTSAAPFNGDFNGNFYRVYNYRIPTRTYSTEANSGLFGFVNGANIYNLRFETRVTQPDGYGYAALAGNVINSKFWGLSAVVTLRGNDYAAGLFYWVRNSEVSYSTINVTSLYDFGRDAVGSIAVYMIGVSVHHVQIFSTMTYAGDAGYWDASQSYVTGLAASADQCSFNNIYVNLQAILPALRTSRPNGVAGMLGGASNSILADIFIEGCFQFGGRPTSDFTGTQEFPYAVGVVYSYQNTITNIVNWVNRGGNCPGFAPSVIMGPVVEPTQLSLPTEGTPQTVQFSTIPQNPELGAVPTRGPPQNGQAATVATTAPGAPSLSNLRSAQAITAFMYQMLQKSS